MPGNKAFYRLFYLRELQILSGKRKANLWILSLMLFTTFTVIGFAEGSLRYLAQKMRDPFINWVTVLPGNLSAMGMQQVIRDLNTDEVKDAFGLKNVVGFNRFQLNFYDYLDILSYYGDGDLDTNRIRPFAARTLAPEDPVMGEIFSGRNHLGGQAFDDPLDYGLIVTAGMLRQLNYPENTPYVWMDMPLLQPGSISRVLRMAIPVPVRGVVRALPGLAGFASSPYFFQQRTTRIGNNPFNPLRDNRLLIAYTGTAEEAREYASVLERVLSEISENTPYRILSVWIEPATQAASQAVQHVYATLSPRSIDLEKLEFFFREAYNHPEMAQNRQQVFRMYDYERQFSVFRQQTDFDRISLNFVNLEQLRSFSLMLLERYQIEVDMAQVESRENYHFVSRLTGIISIVLIVFSIISVLLFVVHLLKKHLDSIRRNLGTFKAFGLSNTLLIGIYMRIVLSMLSVAALAGLAVSALFGYLGGIRILLLAFGSHFEPGRYFSLGSHYLVVALLLLFVSATFVLHYITNKLLNHSPGDLIYERQE